MYMPEMKLNGRKIELLFQGTFDRIFALKKWRTKMDFDHHSANGS